MASTSTSGSKRKAEAMDAFDGIAPSASTSASKLMKKPSYDVFINHRGPDVKSTLASTLYGILTGMALSVFLDSQELEYGDFLPRTIEAAMSSALLHIAIFSERYAESPWCLAELSFMLKTGAKIIPIFYHVEPTDLRHVAQGKGKYAKAFEEHEQKGRYSPEKLEEWKKALHVVSFYTGEIVRNKDDENKMLPKIQISVSKEIKVPLEVAKHPVGLDEIVKDFEMNTLQSTENNQDVQIVGIWGMGGSGKTTLAKELYNRRSSLFKRSSFVFNVRDASTKGLLYEKQKQILQDLGAGNGAFDNIEQGKVTLSKHLRSVRVLIVLDDVDHVDQLDALLPPKEGFERESVIIVTTREYDVLRSWDITTIHKMKAVDPFYAEQLFCWHAFRQPLPWNGFEELVKMFSKACHGLPLSLKVIGAQLYRESRKEQWESLLLKIKRLLPNDIQKTLKISYDTLDDEEKEMFLDVACFFIGEKNSLAIEVWNGFGWSGLQSWEKLLNKCLVEIDDYNLIKMHDHIRDLGKDIAKKQTPYRFWFPQPIINVWNQEKKIIGIQGIMATSNQIKWNSNFVSLYEEKTFPVMVKKTRKVDEFRVCCSNGKLKVNTNGGIWPLSSSLVGLKYLVISGDSFNKIMGEVSRELIWLRWFEIGQRNLPSGFSWNKLRVLELFEEEYGRGHHLEELWGETDGEAPVQLRELIISDCYKFQAFPKSIGHLKHLKKIVVTNSNVTSLPDEFCLLQSLEHLVFYKCTMLSSLPSNFGNLSNLRYLILVFCDRLMRLPDSFKNLMLLEHLNLRGCWQLSFTSEDLNFLENIAKLEFFSLLGCEQLEELPRHITNQASLRELYFSYTRIRELPDNIGQLSRLRKMEMTAVLSTCLPTSLGGLYSLTTLTITNCPKLERLPDSLGGLSVLTNLEIEDCPELERLLDSLGGLSCLTNLKISRCFKLEHLPDSFGHLSSLVALYMWYCDALECLPDSFGDLFSLIKLSILRCGKLKCLPESLGDLSSLKELHIENCPQLETLPKSIRQLSNLQWLDIKKCPINELDFGAGSLPSKSSNLKSICLRKTKVCRISNFENCCPSLERLCGSENHQLKEIEALPGTLQRLHLEDCEMLKSIPSFARLTSLRVFSLGGCYGIEKIEGLENCRGLTNLAVDTCWEVPGIGSLEHMQNLKRLELRANQGSVIERCIQRIQKLPDNITICSRVVPNAASLVDSLLSPNLVLVDSISNQKISSSPKLVQKRSSDSDAFMFCLVINCVSPQMTLETSPLFTSSVTRRGKGLMFEKGRWAWVVVFTQRSYYFSEEVFSIGYNSNGECEEGDEVEKGLVVKGEEQTVQEAFRSLLPLFQTQ